MYLSVVNHVNSTFSEYLEQNSNFVPLGPLYNGMSKEQVHKNLVLHRMHKKFAEPVEAINESRRRATIEKMVAFDNEGINNFQTVLDECDPLVKRHLYRVRHSLHEKLSSYRFSVSNLEFPSGETYVSSGGNTSLYAKLRDRKQWCVTPDCFDLFAKLAYESPLLKYAARRHFLDFQKESGKRFDNAKMFQEWRPRFKNTYQLAFAIFKAKLKCIVTFVAGARITTVPKDLVVDRVIECDAFCNMCVQLSIDGAIKNMIKEHYDVDLLTSQVVHKLLIADENNATIDFSNASNSTFNSVVKWLFGSSRLCKDLQSARCGIVELPDGNIHHLTMLSPMGNGFTFSVMTLILLAIARESDSFAHVFGDDVVCHNDVAPFLIEVYNTIGYKVNTTKTFLDSTFRESCGGFYCEGYLTSFDFEWCLDIVDAAVLCNKVYILSLCIPDLQLRELHRALTEKVPPALLKGYVISGNWATRIIEEVSASVLKNERKSHSYHVPLSSLDDGFWLPPKVVRVLQKKEPKVVAYLNKQKPTIRDLQTSRLYSRTQPYIRITRIATSYRFRNGRRMEPVDNVSRLLSWFYVYCGRVQAPTVNQPLLKTGWEGVLAS